ncbi:MAG: outer membrane protein assembly factor BamD [Cytophagales bacterium]|nr:MAG: outer membrane protein assembly factor BamD [Cytophagales bacterium]TAF62306.1 MAG: outer membrane protein assembly factor BamD [Cytophagales bacterium]
MLRSVFYQLFCVLACLAMLLTNSSCSKLSRALKNPDWKVRYQAANQYYEKGDYYRASLLLEELVSIIKNDPTAEDIHYKFANCCYEENRLVDAEYYFRTFYSTYRQSPKAEDALYMSAVTMSRMSPIWYLDQENTRYAIESIQDFINRFPKSARAKDASDKIIELRQKLEFKEYNNAKLFYKLERHKSAVIVLDNFQKDFPDSKYKEEAAYMSIRALYAYAKSSFEDVQAERFQEVIGRCENFIDKYSKSVYVNETQDIYASARRGLENLAKQKQAIETKKKQSEYDK